MRPIEPHALATLRGPDPTLLAEVAAALDAVRSRGALPEVPGDGPRVFPAHALDAARAGLPPDALDALERTAARYRALAEVACDGIRPLRMPVPGGEAGVRRVPADRVGCLGLRVSDVLSTAVAARVAGAREVWVACPRPGREVLGAAAVAGADAVVAVGGAEAVGALSFGAGPVPACDVIVGTGDARARWARRLVPTPCDAAPDPGLALFADAAADPSRVAADLRAWQERAPHAPCVLVTDAGIVVDRVAAEGAGDRVRALVAPRDVAVRAVEAWGPGRVALHVADPERLAAGFERCGALVVGSGVGPASVDPDVGGFVDAVLRRQPWVRVTSGASLAADAALLATLDGLPAAREAALARSGSADTPVRGRAIGDHQTGGR